MNINHFITIIKNKVYFSVYYNCYMLISNSSRYPILTKIWNTRNLTARSINDDLFTDQFLNYEF